MRFQGDDARVVVSDMYRFYQFVSSSIALRCLFLNNTEKCYTKDICYLNLILYIFRGAFAFL